MTKKMKVTVKKIKKSAQPNTIITYIKHTEDTDVFKVSDAIMVAVNLGWKIPSLTHYKLVIDMMDKDTINQGALQEAKQYLIDGGHTVGELTEDKLTITYSSFWEMRKMLKMIKKEI